MLIAVLDSNYKFLWCNVGRNGSASDCGVFNTSTFRTALEEGTIGFPEPEPLPHDDRNMPYFLIGDDAFPLRTWLMKPFSQKGLTEEERIFNYRLSRARRVVENAFGILAHRFRCLLSTLQQKPDICRKIVCAALCLHNIMRIRYPALQNGDLDGEDENGNAVPGAWRDGHVLQALQNVKEPRQTREGKQQRLYLKSYYNSPVGSVPWQAQMI